jgi:hypothetical protein
VNRETQSFVIRIWDEAVDRRNEGSTWRGFIEHVGSGKRLYFHDPTAILRFIQEEIGVSLNPSRKWWKPLARKNDYGNEN